MNHLNFPAELRGRSADRYRSHRQLVTARWRSDLFNAERSASVGNTALLRVIFILLGLWYLKIDLDALLRAPGKAFFACAAGGMRLRGGQACFAYAAGGQGPAAAPNNPRPGALPLDPDLMLS